MVERSLALVALAALASWFPGAAVASDAPIAVSPGSSSGTLIESRCPTFSWGAADEARSYELIVYRLGETGEDAKPVLQEELIGAATSWTPSFDRCLEAGGVYAWGVRADTGEELGEWSPAKVFEVVSRPSRSDFEAALEIVRSYLQAEGTLEAAPAAAPEGLARVAVGTDAVSDIQTDAPTLRTRQAVVGTTKLSVDGGVVATSFTGDGSTLTALDPTQLSAGTAAISISGNAAGLVCTGCVNQTDIGLGEVTTSRIAPGSISTDRIVALAVTSDKIANDAVGSGQIATNAVGSSEIATGAVGSDEIATDAVGNAELASGLLDASHFNINNVYPLKPTAWCNVTEVDSNSQTSSQCPAGMAIIAISQELDCGDNDRCVTNFTCARPCDLNKQYP
jgi:hypothetical protein